uniref:Uncharacterized protein n=1 Tax=Rhizophora mucronata TaxID=61149 RepID=A0A2P2NHS4_RHIMU
MDIWTHELSSLLKLVGS